MKIFNIKVDKFIQDQVMRHCQNTAVYVQYFSDLIEFKGGNPGQAVTAAEFHDVSKLKWKRKLFIVPYIKLSKHDICTIHVHPANSVKIIEESNLAKSFTAGNPSINDIIYLHHEHPDGSGYYRISDIPIEAAVLSICDIFNACIVERPYKGTMPINVAAAEALKPFIDYFGKEFTEAIEERFREIYSLKDQPFNKWTFSKENILHKELIDLQGMGLPKNVGKKDIFRDNLT